MDSSTIAAIVGLVLTCASVVFGGKYYQSKGKAKQLSSLLSSIIVAAEDDEVSEKEFQTIVASTKALIENPEAAKAERPI